MTAEQLAECEKEVEKLEELIRFFDSHEDKEGASIPVEDWYSKAAVAFTDKWPQLDGSEKSRELADRYNRTLDEFVKISELAGKTLGWID